MKPSRTILLALCVLMLTTLACGLLDGSSDDATPTFSPTRTPSGADKGEATAVPDEPTPEPEEPTPDSEAPSKQVEEPTPEGETSSSGVSLLLNNDAGMAVYYIYISPSDSQDWGEDRLGADVLEPGMSYVITDIPPGTYDLKAEDGDGNIVETVWEVTLEENTPWTITGGSAITIINESSDTIFYVFISSVDSTEWGDDQLGNVTIDPGDGYTFYDIVPGYYDMKVTDTDGDGIEVVYNVALFGEQEWVVVGAALLPDNAVVRFEEDFTDNHNAWGNVETEHTSYLAPADGEYCMLIKSADNTAWEWYEPFHTDEFIAELSCYVEGLQDTSCGLGFGPDGDNLFWFEVSAYDQHYALFLLEDGEWQDQLIYWTESKHINMNAPNYLSLERVDGKISVFVNGIVVGEVWYDGFPEGRIGLGGSTYDDPNATVCLDNLRVWRLE